MTHAVCFACNKLSDAAWNCQTPGCRNFGKPITFQIAKRPATLSEVDEADFLHGFEGLCRVHHLMMRDKGFWPNKPENESPLARIGRVGLICEEIGECITGIRKPQLDEHLRDRAMWQCELADIVLRVMDIAYANGVPLGELIIEKMGYNESRPQMHGNKKA